jgi:hypothetical protein
MLDNYPSEDWMGSDSLEPRRLCGRRGKVEEDGKQEIRK